VDAQSGKTALKLARELNAELAELIPTEPTSQPARVPISSRQALGDWPDLYDLLITDHELVVTSRELFVNRHFAQSVEQAFKYVNNLVKTRSGLTQDGADLMNRAFSPSSPLLKLSALTTQSQKDQQVGYMMMLAGAMTGIRNPRAHEHGHLDDPAAALELLGFANHLAQLIRGATRARRRRAKS
jgi:uncharacterized protein (TIGR02391 family)